MQGGWTPFMMAVWHGHYTAAETLLKMGNAQVDAENEVAIFPLANYAAPRACLSCRNIY